MSSQRHTLGGTGSDQRGRGSAEGAESCVGAALPQGTCPWVAPPPAPPGSSALVPHRAPRAGASALTPSSPGGGPASSPISQVSRARPRGLREAGARGPGVGRTSPAPARGAANGRAAPSGVTRRQRPAPGGRVTCATRPTRRPAPPRAPARTSSRPRPTAGPQVPAVRLGSHLPFLPWASERRRSLFCGSDALGAGVQLRQGFCQGRWPGRAMSSVVRLRDA